MIPVLEVDALRRFYRQRRMLRRGTEVRAVDGVSFTLQAGRTLAVVGESGCGKSTLARMLALLDTPTAGQIRIEGEAASPSNPATRRAVQMVFQDPYGSLNPRQTVGAILEEPLLIAGELPAARRQAALAMMANVGLRPDQLGRYPHQFSGGQRQRIAIARALMLHPKVVIADEPVSALDVSVRAQVLNLLIELQDRLGLAYVFISHDLGVVRHMADEVAVMYLGRIVEQAPREVLFDQPRHPYTRALLAATPGLVPRAGEAEPVRGEPPSPITPPSGCHYHTRCPHVQAVCREAIPLIRPVGETQVACHFAEALPTIASA
jgi:dipeptide transport system ATP-binding protein